MLGATRTWLQHDAGWLLALATMIVASAGAFADQARPVSFRHLTIADGLSQNTVMDVHQDALGYIWFATENGLDRYDGYSVHRYQRGQVTLGELANDYIWQIAEDHRTNLWLATNGAGVAYWQRDTDHFTHFRHDADNPASLSSDQVRTLLLTGDGLWIGTLRDGLNLLDPETGAVKRFRHDPTDPASLPDNGVFALLEDSSGRIWVGTDQGLAWLEPGSDRFNRLQHDPENPSSLSNDRVRALALDRHNTLWVGTFGGGVNALDPRSRRFTRYLPDPTIEGSLSNGHVWDIIEDDMERLWVATASGLNLLSPGTETFTTYTSNDQLDQLSDNYIMSLHQDRGGVLWVGTRSGGANTWNSRSWELGHHRPSSLEQRSTTSFVSDDAGIWIGTMGGGLTYTDELTGAVTHLSTRSTPALTDDRVMSLLLDRRGVLWIGTMEGGINQLSADGRHVSVLSQGESDAAGVGVTGVMRMFEDSTGNVWIGTFGGGVIRFDASRENETVFQPDPDDPASLCGSQGRAFAEDALGALWIGTEKGLCLYDDADGTFHHYRHDPATSGSLADDSVYALHAAADGTLWVGTGGGGLSRVIGSSRQADDVVFETFSRRDGLSSNMIYAIESDLTGRLWLSGNNGLSRLIPESGEVRSFRRSQGLQGDEFHFGSSHRSRSGRLYFGGANGYNSFAPSRLVEASKPPPVVLTGMSTMNQPLTAAETHITSGIIEIGYQAPAVTFEFAALDFTEPESNRYAYRLDGYDNNWVDAGTRRTVSYTNLQSGRYRFRVKAAGSAGNWNESGLSMDIKVTPAPWTTGWAYLGYGLILLSLLWYYLRLNTRKLARQQNYRLRLETEVQERTEELAHRNEELRKLSQVKSEFVARMSHEIRSPINGILGMTELLIRSPLDDQQSKFARTIASSGQSLLHVINDILDYSKLEAAKVELEMIDTDMELLIGEIVDMFALEASRKGLELIVSLPPTGLPGVRADSLRLKQVLVNLLNNAIKFTAHGHVLISIDVLEMEGDCTRLKIAVSDTGIGVAQGNHEKIFESFSQEDDSTTRRFGGTGLGLAICRELLELMGSELMLESVPGDGATFSFDIELPKVAGSTVDDVRALSGGVLIASPRRALSDQISHYLEAWGLRCISTVSAEMALAVLSQPAGATIDAMIVDEQLADFTGPDLLHSALAKGLIQESACILLHGFDAQRLSAIEAHQLAKPIKRRDLLQAVCQVFGRDVREIRQVVAKPTSKLAGRILMVEDDAINQEVFAGMLAELGCNSTFAADGRTGLQLAATESYDAILMDFQLPDINGAEVARRIRAFDGPQAEVPIIALTANATANDEALCLGAGMNAFLTKPCSMTRLAEALSSWLPMVPPADETARRNEDEPATEGQFDELALARIKRLTRPDGSPMLEHAVHLFLRSADEALPKLRSAIADVDADALRFGAHKLKSGCANLGALRMADLCRQLEELGRGGSVLGAELLVDTIEDELASTTGWLEEQLRESA